MKNTATNKKTTTIVNFILDKSGSMDICQAGTIEGFNSYLKKLAKEDTNVLFSLTLFNTGVEKRYSLVPLKDVKPLNKETYDPDGRTALWDAAVNTIEECYERTKDMVENKPSILTVIMTDGEENSSREHDRGCMNDLIAKLQPEGNWTFVYMGANQDSWSNASQIGVSFGNSVNFGSSNVGMKKSFDAIYCATSNLVMQSNAGGGGGGTSNFFEGLKDENNEITQP